MLQSTHTNIEIVPINSIIQDPENARTHSPKQLEYLAASLERFGLQKPILVDSNNVIIAGNGTHLAARDVLGWSEIAVIKSHLSKEEARAYGIADNQLATQSEWDLDSLAKHIKDMSEWNPMQDWSAIGFESEIIEPLLEDSDEEDDSNSEALMNFLEGGTSDTKDSKVIMAKPIKVTEDQWEIIDQAITIAKIQVEDNTLSAGRVLELICADWLSGMRQQYNDTNT